MESLSRSVAFVDQGFLKQWKLPAQFPVGLLRDYEEKSVNNNLL